MTWSRHFHSQREEQGTERKGNISRKDTKCYSPTLNIWAPMGLRSLALPAHDDYGLSLGPAQLVPALSGDVGQLPVSKQLSSTATQSSLSQLRAGPTQEHGADSETLLHTA